MIWVPPKPTQTGHVHWSPIKKEVNIIMSQSNCAVQKDGLVLKITFILSIKYLPIFLTKMEITIQLLSTSDENVYTSQNHPNLKEIGRPQTIQ